MATDPLRRLEEELRNVESPYDLPPDLLYALETLAAAFGTSVEAMRERIIFPTLGGPFITTVPTGHDISPPARLATLVARGLARLPKKMKRQLTREDLIPVRGSISELVIEDRRR